MEAVTKLSLSVQFWLVVWGFYLQLIHIALAGFPTFSKVIIPFPDGVNPAIHNATNQETPHRACFTTTEIFPY